MGNVEPESTLGDKKIMLYACHMCQIADDTGWHRDTTGNEGTKFQEVLASGLVLNYFANE